MTSRDGVRPPFPAGVAVMALAVGFVFTRVLVGYALQHPGVAAAGTFAVVVGVLLSLAGCAVMIWQASGDGSPGVTVVARGVRLLALAPVAGLELAAMNGSLARTGQWWGLAGGCVTLALACGRGVFTARGRWLTAVTLATLWVGESLELCLPLARVSGPPGTRWPVLAERAGSLGELAAFGGVALALAWAVRRTVSAVGGPRAMSFAAMPMALAMVLGTLPLRFPRTTETVARYAFGARFDLAMHAVGGHPSRAALAVYTLLPSGLLAAATVSLAAQGADGGEGTRRSLGWACVLMAGFGGVTMAGPVDPLRLAALCLGALLLEQSSAREALPRT